MFIKPVLKSRLMWKKTFLADYPLISLFLKKTFSFLWYSSRAMNSLEVYFQKFHKYDVLLIHPYKKDAEKGVPNGIATIASYLEKYGVKTLLLDLNVRMLDDNSLKFIIKKTNPPIIGLGAITFQVEEAYRIGRLIKECFPQINLVYGGVHPTFITKEPFKEGKADFVIRGEGEQTILKLFEALKNKKNLSNIPGLIYKKGGKIIRNKKHCFVENMNSLPFPAYHMLNLKSYNTDIHVYPYYKKNAVDLVGSRGCPHNCKYCASPRLYHQIVRSKDAKNIFTEIKYLHSKCGVDCFHLHDDNFLIDEQRTIKFCRLLKENNLRIKWICLTDINTLKKCKSLIPQLAAAGCIGIELGLESADTEVLKGLNKSQDLTCLSEINILMKKYGITPMYLFMSFLPGENLDSIYKTSKMINVLTDGECPNLIEFLKSVHSRFGFGMCANPYPGSMFFNTAKKEGIILANRWEEYYPNKINFIPNSLLADIPIKKRDMNKKEFKNVFKKYREEMLYNRTYTVFPKDKKTNDYPEFVYNIFELCDGKKNVQEIYHVIKKMQKNIDLRILCSALRFLAMFDMIGSRK